MKIARYPSRNRGATLIEVMVALFVLALGLLGYAGMQTQGIMLGRQAYSHSQAIFAAQDIVERIRANSANTSLYAMAFGSSTSAGTNCESSVCSPTQVAAWDLTQWTTMLSTILPAGEGEIQVGSTGGVDLVTVQVRYQLGSPRLNAGEDEPEEEAKTNTYILETQI